VGKTCRNAAQWCPPDDVGVPQQRSSWCLCLWATWARCPREDNGTPHDDRYAPAGPPPGMRNDLFDTSHTLASRSSANPVCIIALGLAAYETSAEGKLTADVEHNDGRQRDMYYTRRGGSRNRLIAGAAAIASGGVRTPDDSTGIAVVCGDSTVSMPP